MVRTSVSLILTLGLVVACGDDVTSPAELGSAPDTGLDLGTSPDSGSALDTGSADTGAAADLGATDASDSGFLPDATPGDTGPMDSGASADGGPTLDGGPGDAGPGDAGPTDGGADAGASDGGATDAGAGPSCDPTFGAAGMTCGGTPSGIWNFREACGPSPVESMFTALCPAASISMRTRTATGTLSFTGTNFSLDLRETLSAQAQIPSICVIAGCAGVQATLQNAGATATCMPSTIGGCVCDVTTSFTETESGTFTVSGGTLTTGSLTFNHCLSSAPANLTVREVQSGSVYVLTP